MSFLPTNDIASWPQIVLEIDAAIMRVVDMAIAEELQAADEDIVRLAQSQIAEDRNFADAVLNALKAIDAAGGMLAIGGTNG